MADASQTQKQSNWSDQLAIVLASTLFLFLLVSFLTFHFDDPSPYSYRFPPALKPASNAGGTWGAMTMSFLLFHFGLAWFWFASGGLLLGVTSRKTKLTGKAQALQWLGFLLSVLAVCLLLQQSHMETYWGGTSWLPGGRIGLILEEALLPLLGSIGLIIASLGLFLSSLILISQRQALRFRLNDLLRQAVPWTLKKKS